MLLIGRCEMLMACCIVQTKSLELLAKKKLPKLVSPVQYQKPYFSINIPASNSSR
jgi:hypothetical protein